MTSPTVFPAPGLYPYAFLYPGNSPAPGVVLTVGEARTRTLDVTGGAVSVNLSPIDRLYADIPIAATLRDGAAVTVAAVDVALLPWRVPPSSTTTWTTGLAVTGGVVTVLLAGPDADPAGAVAVPAGASQLWLRLTESPEVEAVKAASVFVS